MAIHRAALGGRGEWREKRGKFCYEFAYRDRPSRTEQSKSNNVVKRWHDSARRLLKKLISFRRRKGSNNNNTKNVKARSPPEISNSRKRRERGKREEI